MALNDAQVIKIKVPLKELLQMGLFNVCSTDDVITGALARMCLPAPLYRYPLWIQQPALYYGLFMAVD